MEPELVGVPGEGGVPDAVWDPDGDDEGLGDAVAVAEAVEVATGRNADWHVASSEKLALPDDTSGAPMHAPTKTRHARWFVSATTTAYVTALAPCAAP